MNHYPRHIGDYLKDTAHLTLLEHGIYTRLLDVYYTREGAIPDEQAARLVGARSKDERDSLQAVLSEFFVLEADGWHQKRADAEIERYREKAKRNREVGVLGGRPRTQTEPRNNPDGFRNVTQTEPTDNPSHKPIANSQEPNKSSRARGARLAPDWVLPKAWGEWALQEQRSWDADYCRRVGEKFKDHWLAAPGVRGIKLDWEATWRNWVRNEGPMRADQKPKLTLAELMEKEDRDAA